MIELIKAQRVKIRNKTQFNSQWYKVIEDHAHYEFVATQKLKVGLKYKMFLIKY